MHSVSSTQSSVQLGLFDAITDLLSVNPIFLLGVLVIGVTLLILFKNNRFLPKIRITLVSFVFYYYLCVLLTSIVGIPNLSEYIRLSGLGESFFHPNVNLIPFHDGLSSSFLLNILLFVPLGFFSPLISTHYQRAKNALLLGFGLSLSIEIVQLFTLYRATDIDDLITNVVGTLIGYLCFRFAHKLVLTKCHPMRAFTEPHSMRYLPIIIITTTFLLGFLK